MMYDNIIVEELYVSSSEEYLVKFPKLSFITVQCLEIF